MKRLRALPVDALVAEYRRAAGLNGRATVRRDAPTAGRTEQALEALGRELLGRPDGPAALLPLLDDADPSVVVWAGAHLLRDDGLRDAARGALERLAAGDHALGAHSARRILAGG